MKSIAIYTPINADYDSLFALKACLDRQTTKDFVWHIISWGDDICTIIDRLRYNSNYDILYDQIQVKGKYLATEFMFNHTEEPYIIGCPCEFELKENAIETIIRQWHDIQRNMDNNVAEVRALCGTPSKNVARYMSEYPSISYLDATWHEMVLKNGVSIQAITSWDVAKFKECVRMSDYTLFQNKYNELSTSLFWSAIGRKYQTRYLFEQIAQERQDVCTNKTLPNRYNDVVAYYYMLTQNLSYSSYKPKFFFKTAIHLLVATLKIIIK